MLRHTSWSPGTYKIHGVHVDKDYDVGGAIDFYVGECRDRISNDVMGCLAGQEFDGEY